MGMGGAEVAAVDDNSATWSNPAALAGLQGWEFQVLGAASPPRTATISSGLVIDLSELPFDEIAGGRRSGARSRCSRRHRATWRGRARASSPRGWSGLAASWKGFALSIGDVPYAGIYPVIDLQHVVPGGGPDNGLEFNETGLYLPASRRARPGSATATTSSAACSRSAAPARYVSGVTYFGRCGVFERRLRRATTSRI